jgi:hypothetical protein
MSSSQHLQSSKTQPYSAVVSVKKFGTEKESHSFHLISTFGETSLGAMLG